MQCYFDLLIEQIKTILMIGKEICIFKILHHDWSALLWMTLTMSYLCVLITSTMLNSVYWCIYMILCIANIVVNRDIQ